ncbi:MULTISPECIES: hypothetical protein [unclassified Myroides]|uniref:hypothetical protein n=1 Tax=unclassified Myroides TaxID=2642485 RepID=UPI003D2F877C
MYCEKMNIYRQRSAQFIVTFVCIILLLFSVITGDYLFLGATTVFVLGVHLYARSLDYTIEHTADALVFGLCRKHTVLLEEIEEMTIENLDYVGKFGGYGYRRFRRKHAYVFSDSGDFLCVKTANKDYFLSIKDKNYWKNWLEKQSECL